MSLINTLSFIINHPLNRNNKAKALIRFLKWQFNTKMNPYPIIYPYGEKSKLIIWKGLTGATGNLYCGLHEFEGMSFLLHFLRKDDLFVDIGANIGSYTVLGSSEIEATTVSIEPVPQTFKNLENNIRINNAECRVRSINIGLGSKKGILKFTNDLDTVNHVAVSTETNTIGVQVEMFDDIIKIQKPTLIKIDVEGFETEVLHGMKNALTSDDLKAVIIELNGSGSRYGYDEEKIHAHLINSGFKPYIYKPFDRHLIDIKKYGNNNTIYIRDFEFVNNRVKQARKFKIMENEI